MKITTTKQGGIEITLTEPDRAAIARTLNLVRDLETEWPKAQNLVDRTSLREFLKDPEAMAEKWTPRRIPRDTPEETPPADPGRKIGSPAGED